ncbi:hypothetical protein [Corynebacterium phocae]|uniref:hypothetical protein n=1 Tax=Corynebacterium phocae TaxID=161895 RepID=UPI00123B1885|nr:hypothetical protein [Corynebacterium phocae]KAA8728579.1 hypothetical protein F4V58_00445 [Corynebacterium phocae]
MQFPTDDAVVKILWLTLCFQEDRRALKRAKQAKQRGTGSGRMIEGARVAGWAVALNQMAITNPDLFNKYL